MDKIKAVIVDDEINCISSLRILFDEISADIEVVGEATRVEQGVEIIKKENPDLVFLDIEMPKKSGFDLLKAFDKPNFKVIFITGYSHYAIQAIKFSALDYILKPIDKEELAAAIKRSREEIGSQKSRLENFEKLLERPTPNFIVIPSTNGYSKVPLNTILYIEAQSGNYSIFYTNVGKTLVATKPLNYYENLLPQNSFFRCHRSYVVNINKIKEWESLNNELVLQNETRLRVSARKKNKLKTLFKNNA